MDEPSKEVVDRLKAQYVARAINRVECTIGDDTVMFVMTGPTPAEYERFTEEVELALAMKSVTERERATRSAVQRAALAQIQWPDRDAATETFVKYPALSGQLARTLHDSAGFSAEVRAKKL